MKSDTQILKDVHSLRSFVSEASKYDAVLSSRMHFKNLSASITRKKCKPTPSGKEPKYLYTCKIDITDIPVNPDFLDDYLDLLDIATPQQRVQLEHKMEEDRNRKLDTLIVHLSYKRGGKVGKARIYYWHNDICHIVFLSEKRGELSLSKVAKKGLYAKKETVLYKRS